MIIRSISRPEIVDVMGSIRQRRVRVIERNRLDRLRVVPPRPREMPSPRSGLRPGSTHFRPPTEDPNHPADPTVHAGPDEAAFNQPVANRFQVPGAELSTGHATVLSAKFSDGIPHRRQFRRGFAMLDVMPLGMLPERREQFINRDELLPPLRVVSDRALLQQELPD